MAMTAIILAAGEGTRMKSRHPKVMHKLLDRPLVSWVTRAARVAGADRIVVVVGNGAEEVRAHLAAETDVECVEQTERLGTAHATRVAIEAAGIGEGPVVVLNGDLPLIEPETIRAFAQSVSGGQHAAAILTMTPPDPFGYGRIELAEDGSVTRIIEQKDCTPEQAAGLLECNAGCYAFDGALLAKYIGEVGNQNAQSEYYLPDMVEILRGHGYATTITHCEDYREGLGVNSRIQLAELSALAQAKINEGLMASGVTMLDPKTVWVGPDVTVGRDTELLPMTMLWGSTSVGEGCVLGPTTSRLRRPSAPTSPSTTASPAARAPTFAAAPTCSRAPTSAPTSSSRTPWWAAAPRCPTSPPSATAPWETTSTSAAAPSRATTTASTRAAPPSETTSSLALTP